ncbi:MAG: metal ABC transporter permease, partial [Verrucomicrobiota bacterium]
MNWAPLDTWIVLTASLIAMACVVPGVFLLLSRQSMVAHGIAHAVLPGIVIGHLVTGGVETPALLTGAILAGLLCAL